MKRLGFASIALSMLLLAGCGMQSAPEVQPTLQDQISLYCLDHEGNLEMREESWRLQGYCVFADESECAEADFFNGVCKAGEIFGEASKRWESWALSADEAVEVEVNSGSAEADSGADEIVLEQRVF